MATLTEQYGDTVSSEAFRKLLGETYDYYLVAYNA
jgi:hypothetical protein